MVYLEDLSKYGLTMEYPTSWRPEDRGNDDGETSFGFEIIDSPIDEFNVMIKDLPSRNTSLKEYADMEFASLKYEDFAEPISDPIETTIGQNIPGYEVEYRWQSNDMEEYKGKQIYITNKKEKGITIDFDMVTTSYDGYYSTVKNVIDSIEFIP